MNKQNLNDLAKRPAAVLARRIAELTAMSNEQYELARNVDAHLAACQNLLGELYQVLGALDAGAKVLDQVSAAINGQPLPHETLLPYACQSAKGKRADHVFVEFDKLRKAMSIYGLAAPGSNHDLGARMERHIIDVIEAVARMPFPYPPAGDRADAEEHELLGYIEPPVLLDLLQGSDATTKIRSAVPSLTNLTPGPGEEWAVPIYVVRRQGEQQ